MRTIRTKVYTFNELSKEAQEKAIENNFYINVTHDWWSITYEDAERIGLKITSFDLERRQVTGSYFTDAYNCANEIIKEHGEQCESYSFAVGYLAAYNNLNSGLEDNQDFEEIDDEFLGNILSYYADFLQKEFEYLQSEEAIKENLIANNDEFLKDGSNYSY
jgi:hypothetical protein